MKKVLLMVLTGMLCLQVTAWADELPDKRVQFDEREFKLHAASIYPDKIHNEYECGIFWRGCTLQNGEKQRRIWVDHARGKGFGKIGSRVQAHIKASAEWKHKEFDNAVVGNNYFFCETVLTSYGDGLLVFTRIGEDVEVTLMLYYTSQRWEEIKTNGELRSLFDKFMRWKEPDAVKLNGWTEVENDAPSDDGSAKGSDEGGSDGSSAKPEAPSSGGNSQSIHAVGWVNPKTGKRRSVTF